MMDGYLTIINFRATLEWKQQEANMTWQTAEEFLQEMNEGSEDGAYRFREVPSAVYMGGCSSGEGGGDTAPLGSGRLDWRTPNEDYFRRLLADKAPGTVLVLASCCGNFVEEFRGKLKALFPAFDFIFPVQADYCANPAPWRIINDLVRAGILIKK